MIYLDNAATSCPKPPAVVQAVADSLNTFGGVGRGVHEAAMNAGMAVYNARDAVASLLGAPGPEHVSFANNATMALNQAIEGLLPDNGVAVTTAASHNSVLRPLFRARDERGCEVRVAPINPDGSLDEEAYKKMLDGADLVVLTHASNLTGDVYDAEKLTRMAHDAGAKVVLDAAQTAGHIPLDMGKLGVDVLCFTGHKGLLGPQGTGGLCAAEGIEMAPLLEGGTGTNTYDERQPLLMPEALEAGTPNAHGLAGMTAGIEWLNEEGLENVAEREASLAKEARERLAAIPGVRLYGGGESESTGIVPFNIGDLDSGEVATRLGSEFGIATRAGAHCAPLMHRAIGTEHQGAVRASFGPFNTEEDVDALVGAVRLIADENQAKDVSIG